MDNLVFNNKTLLKQLIQQACVSIMRCSILEMMNFEQIDL